MPIDSAYLTTNYVSTQSAWYAIYTRHQHEKVVAQALTRKGFETFLPLYAITRRWRDRTKVVSLPLFPCYVFLKGGIERRLDLITTPGIHALVSSAGEPSPIPPNEIEGIRRVVGSSFHVEPYPFLKCGQRVEVKTGPLAGVQGILVRKKSHYRLVLSVEMLGKAVSVEVNGFMVSRLNIKFDAQCAVAASVAERQQTSNSAKPLPLGH